MNHRIERPIDRVSPTGPRALAARVLLAISLKDVLLE
jgi:hypothetical protein